MVLYGTVIGLLPDQQFVVYNITHANISRYTVLAVTHALHFAISTNCISGLDTDFSRLGNGWYRVCVAVWILVGLAWFSGIIAACQGFLEKETVQDEKKEPDYWVEGDKKPLPDSNGVHYSQTSVPMSDVQSTDVIIT